MMRVEASMVMVCWWIGKCWEDTGLGVAVAAAAAGLAGSGFDGVGPFGVVGTVEWRDCRSRRSV